MSAETSRSTEAQTEGLEAVAKFHESEWFAERYIDQAEPWSERVAEPAAQGDLSGVKTDLQSCGYFYDNQ